MALYDTEILTTMCEQVDLLEYASESFDFSLKGTDSYATNCPLHTDKTPSLFITPSKNLFYCQSCHVGGNIINWMRTIEGLTFNQSVEKLSKITNTEIKNLKQSETLQYFKSIKRITNCKKNEIIERPMLDFSADYLNKFSDEIPDEWIKEGITKDVMKMYNIMIDNNANRIVYPIYDNDFNLIGIKGRTRYENFKDIGIQKYMNYKKIGKMDFFVGLKEQKDWIFANQTVILFEGIKSCMKCEGWGIHGSIACETSYINEDQVKILIKMGIKDVTVCFDTDCEIKKIVECTEMLRKFCNVYVVRDRCRVEDRLLGEKMSPVDAGEDVFRTLFKERIKL